LIREPSLQSELRKTLIALITQDVHNRDIVESLMEVENGVNKNDFIWNQQLRMYFEGENIEAVAVARQVNA
jgi:general stress protein 26